MNLNTLDENRKAFELFILARVNERGQHYNQYFPAGGMGILHLYIGHHGNWDMDWIDWKDIDTKALVDYLDMVEDDIKLLRKAGCVCEKPLLGDRPGVGPRCGLCNTIASNHTGYDCKCPECIHDSADI